MTRPHRVLTIAGSDSGGCAGIQADLRTFSAFGVHGLTAITSVTAQNTVGVQSVLHLPEDLVEAQIRSVVEDIGVDAAKTGMLATSALIRVVARAIRRYQIDALVVDPVMVSTSGHSLIDETAVSALVDHLFPLARVVTPNLPEVQRLTGLEPEGPDEVRRAAQILLEMGCRAVVIKGGHDLNESSSSDYLADGDTFLELPARRIGTRNTHGSGCTFSAAIAARLAAGRNLAQAVTEAKRFVTAAIQAAYPLGRGCGPLGHFRADSSAAVDPKAD